MEPLNPYHAWLGLDPELVEPDHFQLLGLSPEEDDARQISAAADRAATRVRSHRPGDRAAQWAALLDRIREARTCLLDAEQRAQYRASQAAVENGSTPPSDPQSSSATAGNPNLLPPAGGPGMPSESVENSANPAAASSTVPMATPVASGPGSVPAGGSVPPGYAGYPGQASAAPQAAPAGSSGVPMALPVNPYAAATPPGGMGQPPTGGPYSMGGPYPMGPAAPGPVPMGGSYPVAPVPTGSVPMGTATYPAGLAPELDPMAPVGGLNPPAPPEPPAEPQPADPFGLASSSAEEDSGPPPQVAGKSQARQTSRRIRESKSAPVFFAIGAILILLTGGVLILTLGPGSKPVAEAPDPAAAGRTTPPAVQPSRVGPARNPIEPRPGSPAPGPKPEPPAPTIDPEPVTPEPTSPEPPKPEPTTPEPPNPEPTPEPPTPEPPTPEPPKPEPPKPEPPKPAMKVTVTRDQVEQLGKHLAAARAALKARDMATANAELGKAKPLAQLPEHRARYERLNQWVRYVDGFWEAVSDAVVGFEGGEMFDVGNLKIIVVEGSAERLAIKYNGQTRRYLLKELPGGLAVAISDQWFDESKAENLVFKGAFAATMIGIDDNAETRARQWWQEAIAGGVDVSELLPVLEDKYDDLADEYDAWKQANPE